MRGACVALLLAAVAACSGGGNNQSADAALANQCGTCDSPNMCCNTTSGQFCIAVASDLENCGSCGNACDAVRSNTCSGMACKCGFGPECGTGSTCCGTNGCKDTMNDGSNCGMCGNVCGDGTTCSGGQCLCGGHACNSGESCCGGNCVNEQTDSTNCGKCGNACTGDANTCNAGSCGCPGGGTSCPVMMTGGLKVVPACCGTGCADLCGDTNNCGTCGYVCSAHGGIGCLFGQCLGDTSANPPGSLAGCL